jgi:hypothetical protein
MMKCLGPEMEQALLNEPASTALRFVTLLHGQVNGMTACQSGDTRCGKLCHLLLMN